MIRVDTPRTRYGTVQFDAATADHTDGCGQPPPGIQTGRVCAGTGKALSCQLCPHSPDYGQRSPRPATPPTNPVVAAPAAAGVCLDWSESVHADRAHPRPCRVCGSETILRDNAGLPCHKVCAEGEASAGPGDREAGQLL